MYIDLAALRSTVYTCTIIHDTRGNENYNNYDAEVSPAVVRMCRLEGIVGGRSSSLSYSTWNSFADFLQWLTSK